MTTIDDDDDDDDDDAEEGEGEDEDEDGNEGDGDCYGGGGGGGAGDDDDDDDDDGSGDVDHVNCHHSLAGTLGKNFRENAFGCKRILDFTMFLPDIDSAVGALCSLSICK